MKAWFGRDKRKQQDSGVAPRAGRNLRSARELSKRAMGANPLLASNTPVWRSRLMVGMMVACFGLLAARAAYVQIVGNSFFLRQGEVRFTRTLEMSANRGRILDRNGLILASSVPAESIWVDPSELDAEEDKAKLQEMAKLLGMAWVDVEKRVTADKRTFVYVKRQVPTDVAKKVADLGIAGIYQQREYVRQYPEGEAVSHIVGFTDVEDKGQEGIEKTFNAQLAGKPGSRRVMRDRFGRVVENIGEITPPTDGQDIHLTIDSKVQYFAWEKLRDAVKSAGAKGGSVVVLDVQTGEVLALANYPSYDPNNRRNLTGEQLRNRALTDIYEPGSTVKPLTAAMALDLGRIQPSTVIATGNGKMTLYGHTISDTHGYGALTIDGVIQKSSNVGAIKIGDRMSAQEMWDGMRAVGLGVKPDLPFPGTAAGRVRPVKGWMPVEKATMSYGYGLSASLFQITRMYSVFARDGVMMPLTLVRDGAVDENGKFTPLAKSDGVQVFSSKTAKQVLHMLHLVTLPGGTAQQAQTMGYSVGGKTGTARKAEGKGYSKGKYRASFVGIAPIEAPRIVVGVMLDEPSSSIYGGAVTAPVFSDVVQQTLRVLGVPPDMSVRPAVIAADAPKESP